MRSPGSVLIVVLGLLAILAVVGLTFVTMSSIDRRTAANFALQSQFMLAADGAVDYVCHHLIQDLWYYDTKTMQYHDFLLTDQNSGAGEDMPLARNEPFDCPRPEYDPWLSTTPNGESIDTGQFSYGEKRGAHYGLASWGLDTPTNERPNNLGWPTAGQVRPYTQGNGHGVWNPDLSFPFDVGLIRVSVTVLDHAGMVNLNAHGRSSASVGECPRYGYFISDVDPSHFVSDVEGLLNGAGQVPGLWSGQNKPYNDHLYEAIIENPGRYHDKPFTLDEEFELRRLIGTHFKSRLEEFGGGNLDSAPDTVTDARARNRLSLTTVSWTSEVRPDFEGPGGEVLQVETKLPSGDNAEWSPRKIDLNLDPIEYISDAMTTGYVFDETDEVSKKIRNQLLANIAAFRDGSGPDDPEDPEDMTIRTWPEAGDRVGAAPQPLFSKIKISKDSQQIDIDGQPTTTWAVEVQVISPWRGNVYGDKDGLTVDDVILTAIPTDGYTGSITWEEPVFPLPERMPLPSAENQWMFTAKVTTQGTDPVASALQRIELRTAGMAIDRIDATVLADIGDGGSKQRSIARGEMEKRRPGDTESIDVVYIGNWVDGDGEGMTSFKFAEPPDPGTGIPIRFPRSVKVSTDKEETDKRTLPEKGLPPYPMKDNAGEDISFRAFARLADLNQVLCPTREDYADLEEGEDGFWPWVTRVADKADLTGQALLTAEEKLKFNWNDVEPVPGTYSRMNAANVFCVGGPWLDELDNDGDGCADEDGTTAFALADEGIGPEGANDDDKGRFGGPELRVAGKINLNTATEDTLRALAKTFDLPEAIMKDWVTTARNQKALVTPWQFLKDHSSFTDLEAVPGDRVEARGTVEKRDLPYTLISNVATVRSDTFSIYGTIEYGLISRPSNVAEFKVMRRRRFWALVDRSPCLAYPPGQLGGDENFIRPRILNFQWLD